MRTKLLFQALGKFIAGFLMMGAFLFLPAGTLEYKNAWLFLAMLFIPMFILGCILFVKAPRLLEKRLRSKEKEKQQKHVVVLSLFMFAGGFVVAALDFRFGWTHLPMGVVIAGSVVLLISYGLYGEVMRENAYLSRTVEIQEDQKVIDTGLYGVVRHPMYFATTLLFLSFPIVLGSLAAFFIFLIYPFLLVKRIKNEEAVLEKGLEGYMDYKKKVRYRMLPFIW